VAKLPECSGKVAVLGYCLGGLMTFLTAVRYGADAGVVYHGGDTEKYLGEVNGLDAPLLMHLAEEDEFISKPAQAEIKAALAGKSNVTIYSYPGQHHAFARHNGMHYNAAAGSARKRADKRISTSTTAVTFGPPSVSSDSIPTGDDYNLPLLRERALRGFSVAAAPWLLARRQCDGVMCSMRLKLRVNAAWSQKPDSSQLLQETCWFVRAGLWHAQSEVE
jgi:hypothetical protein